MSHAANVRSTGVHPLVIADASSLIQIAKAAESMATNSGGVKDSVDGCKKVLDSLASSNATMVLPRNVFDEVFRTNSSSQTSGNAFTGSVVPYEDQLIKFFRRNKIGWLKYDHSKVLYSVFKSYFNEGRVRYYPEIQAMIDAGEVDKPKGGIIVVEADAHSHNKSERQEGAEGYLLNLVEQHGHPILGQANRSPDLGDGCVDCLSTAIITHLRDNHAGARFLVLNDDYRLSNMLSNHHQMIIPNSSSRPIIANSNELILALAANKTLAEEDAEPLLAASAALHSKGRVPLQSFDRNVHAVSSWLSGEEPKLCRGGGR